MSFEFKIDDKLNDTHFGTISIRKELFGDCRVVQSNVKSSDSSQWKRQRVQSFSIKMATAGDKTDKRVLPIITWSHLTSAQCTDTDILDVYELETRERSNPLPFARKPVHNSVWDVYLFAATHQISCAEQPATTQKREQLNKYTMRLWYHYQCAHFYYPWIGFFFGSSTLHCSWCASGRVKWLFCRYLCPWSCSLTIFLRYLNFRTLAAADGI